MSESEFDIWFGDEVKDIFNDYQASHDLNAFKHDFSELFYDLDDFENDNKDGSKISPTAELWAGVFEIQNIDFLKTLRNAYSQDSFVHFNFHEINQAYKRYCDSCKDKQMSPADIVGFRVKKALYNDLVDMCFANKQEQKVFAHRKKGSFPNILICPQYGPELLFRGISKREVDNYGLYAAVSRMAEKTLLGGQVVQELFQMEKLYHVFSKTEHTPLLDLFIQNGNTIYIAAEEYRCANTMYLPKSGVLILKSPELKELHQGLMYFADDCLKFSQTPVFQKIANNYMNQSERQMMLPFAEEFSYSLSPTDLKMAKFIRQHMTYAGDNYTSFSSEMTPLMAELSYDKEYDYSRMRSGVIRFVDVYAQAVLNKETGRLNIIHALLQDKSVTLRSDFFDAFNNWATATVKKVKSHPIGSQALQTKSRQKEE